MVSVTQPPGKSIHQLLADRYGVAVRSESDPDGNVSVDTTAEVLVRPNPARIGLLIVNLSSNIVYVKPGKGVSATSGIVLSPQGGSLTVDYLEDFDLPAREWQAVASAAASNVLVVESMVQPGGLS